MKRTKLLFPMRIQRLGEGEYFIDYPLPEMTIGAGAATMQEAMEVAKNALEFTLFERLEGKESLPTVEEEEILKIEKEGNEHIAIIVTSEKEIYEYYGLKPVKQTIIFPRYQEKWLEDKQIRLSLFIQEQIEQLMMKDELPET